MTTEISLGLPAGIRACLFDVDGVLTETAKVHATAWKQMFDAYLKERADESGEPFVAFDKETDYDRYVDGKPRADGTRSFLESRHLHLSEGAPDDKPGAPTICGLSNKKNEIVLRKIREDGVEPYAGSLRYVRAMCAAGLRRAAVSSSANCAEVLTAAGIAELFEVRIDGITVKADHLAGKPAPETFLAAAHALGVDPERAAVFEDALSGVEAGRAGSVSWSGSTGWDRPTPYSPMAPTPSCLTWASCWTGRDHASGLPGRTLVPARDRARP
jgi:beta-phosphoglucomutase family hydrolase